MSDMQRTAPAERSSTRRHVLVLVESLACCKLVCLPQQSSKLDGCMRPAIPIPSVHIVIANTGRVGQDMIRWNKQSTHGEASQMAVKDID